MSEHRRTGRQAASRETERHPVSNVSGRATSLPFNRTTAWLAGLAIGGILLLVLGLPIPSAATRSATAYSADGVGGESVTGLTEDGVADAATELSTADAANRMDQLRASRATRDAATPAWVNPVPGARFTSCFCMRWGAMHWGIDLAAPVGTPMYSVGDGVVLKAGPASGFGLAIYIQHENGDVTVYGHMFVMDVKTGDIVRAGQQIAEVGANGQSTGPHLHLEVHQGGIGGTKLDPLPWLAARGVIIT